MNNSVKRTTLHFIRPDSTGTPVVNYSGFDETQAYSDDYRFLETDIISARTPPNEKTFSLDREAFRLVNFCPTEIDFLDPTAVKTAYYPSVEALVKEATGADQAFAFDHTVRRGIADSNRHPAYHVHNDYTFETGKTRAASFLGNAVVERFSGKRMIQINVWRSIAGVVEKDPLALLDATTLEVADLVKTEIRFNDMTTGDTHLGEIFALKKNAAQRWYYFPEMDSEEALLIKGFDTDRSVSCFAMHSAFPLAEQGPRNKPRQSIETRVYAFFDE